MDSEASKKIMPIITIVAIVGLVVFSLFKTGYLNDSSDNSTASKPKTEEKKYHSIDNNAIKDDLALKVQIINLTYGDATRRNGSSDFFEKGYYKNIDDSRLLYALITYLHLNNDDSIKKPEQEMYFEYPNLLGTIDDNIVKEKSLQIFNKDLSNLAEAPKDDSYDTAWLGIVKDGNKYMINSAGGDPSPSNMLFTNIYKYERDDQNAYVYVSVAKGSISDDGTSYIIYKGPESREIFKIYNESAIEEYLNFQITEDNKNNFTRYKYVFASVDGNYYFNHIEKVE